MTASVSAPVAGVTADDAAHTSATPAIREQRVASADVELAVYERGERAAPAVLLLHGYPDTHTVWDPVAELLESHFHVVSFDLRGMGASTATAAPDGFALEHLVDDLRAVIDAVSPDRPVHLVGHDWGSIIGWDAVTDPRLSGRIASFTSLSGPSLDHAGQWLHEHLRSPRPGQIAELTGQGLRSWYIGAFHIPGLPAMARRARLAAGSMAALRRIERVAPSSGYPSPTQPRDVATGIALYRSNMSQRLRHPRPEATTDVPVQVVVATRDHFVSPALAADLDRWVPRLWRRRIRARHWVLRTHPEQVARYISEFVDHIEGAPQTPSLARSRSSGRARSLEGRLAVVTGAGSGIGRATALRFAEEGAEVVVADIDGTAAARTAELARLLGPAAHVHVVDVADARAMEEFAATVARDHGVPDIVVNNAGIGLAGSFLDTSEADWERILGVNLRGVINGCRLFGLQMARQGTGGQIVNIASAAAYIPSRALPAYSTTKAAVLMLSECLRAELAGTGIGVTAICPGLIETNITRTTRFVGMDAEQQAAARTSAARLYRRRNFSPERVADRILTAVHANRAVVPVTVEARGMRLLSRLSPAAMRLLARLDATPH